VSLRTVLILILALVFGVSASLGVVTVMRSSAAPPPPPKIETVPVVVAAADLPRFSTVTAEYLTTQEFPKELVPPGALTRVEDAADRVALSPLFRGEPVYESKLAGRGAGRGMAPGIAKGKRAFTIQTPNVAVGVAGFVLPGDKVDVLLTVNGNGPNDPNGGGASVTLLQDVEILAVDQRVDAPSDNKVDAKELRSVTLLVTPDEAAKLDLGGNKGTLHLTLRNPEDTAHAPTRRATLVEIGLQEEKPKEVPPAEKTSAADPTPPPPPPPLRIRTLRGAQEGAVLIYPGGTAPDGR
jgi:pilus assembly protein CpaB